MQKYPSASGGNGSEVTNYDRIPIGVFANEVNLLRIETKKWKGQVLTQKDIKEIERLNDSVRWKLDNLETIGHPCADRVRQIMACNNCQPWSPGEDGVGIALQWYRDEYEREMQKEKTMMRLTEAIKSLIELMEFKGAGQETETEDQIRLDETAEILAKLKIKGWIEGKDDCDALEEAIKTIEAIKSKWQIGEMEEYKKYPHFSVVSEEAAGRISCAISKDVSLILAHVSEDLSRAWQQLLHLATEFQHGKKDDENVIVMVSQERRTQQPEGLREAA